MTTEEQYIYIRTLMAEVDERSQRRTAINKARAQGLEEGRAKGLKEGLSEGKAEVARSLREKGIPVSTIAEACGLSEDQVLSL